MRQRTPNSAQCLKSALQYSKMSPRAVQTTRKLVWRPVRRRDRQTKRSARTQAEQTCCVVANDRPTDDTGPTQRLVVQPLRGGVARHLHPNLRHSGRSAGRFRDILQAAGQRHVLQPLAEVTEENDVLHATGQHHDLQALAGGSD